MKKAQLAVETLLIYGLAILIVMLAIGALFATGFLDFGSFIGDTCKMRSKELTCAKHYVNANGNDAIIQIEVENMAGNNLYIKSINYTGSGDSEGLIDDEDCYETYAGDGLLVVNGDKKLLEVTGCGDLSALEGKKVSAEIKIVYGEVGSAITPVIYGDLRATVGG